MLEVIVQATAALPNHADVAAFDPGGQPLPGRRDKARSPAHGNQARSFYRAPHPSSLPGLTRQSMRRCRAYVGCGSRCGDPHGPPGLRPAVDQENRSSHWDKRNTGPAVQPLLEFVGWLRRAAPQPTLRAPWQVVHDHLRCKVADERNEFIECRSFDMQAGNVRLRIEYAGLSVPGGGDREGSGTVVRFGAHVGKLCERSRLANGSPSAACRRQ